MSETQRKKRTNTGIFNQINDKISKQPEKEASHLSEDFPSLTWSPPHRSLLVTPSCLLFPQESTHAPKEVDAKIVIQPQRIKGVEVCMESHSRSPDPPCTQVPKKDNVDSVGSTIWTLLRCLPNMRRRIVGWRHRHRHVPL